MCVDPTGAGARNWVARCLLDRQSMERVLSLPSRDTLVFQRALTAFNRRRLTPTCGALPRLEHENAWRMREQAFVAERRANIADRASEAPRDPGAFVRWFEELERTGPG